MWMLIGALAYVTMLAGVMASNAPLVNESYVEIWSSATTLTVSGMYFANDPDAITVRFETTSSMAPKGFVEVANETMLHIRLEGVTNQMLGTLSMFVNITEAKSSPRTSDDYTPVATIVEAPIVMSTSVSHPSHVEALLVTGDSFGTSVSNIIVELWTPARHMFPNVEFVDDNLILVTSKFNTTDVGWLRAKVYRLDWGRDSGWIKIATLITGRSEAASSFLIEKQEARIYEMTFGMTESRVEPSTIVLQSMGADDDLDTGDDDDMFWGLSEDEMEMLEMLQSGDMGDDEVEALFIEFFGEDMYTDFISQTTAETWDDWYGDGTKVHPCEEDWRCGDGRVIPFCFVCDGKFDCRQKEDEAECGNFLCDDELFDIKRKWVCDGMEDCLDGSDETTGCNRPPPPPPQPKPNPPPASTPPPLSPVPQNDTQQQPPQNDTQPQPPQPPGPTPPPGEDPPPGRRRRSEAAAATGEAPGHMLSDTARRRRHIKGSHAAMRRLLSWLLRKEAPTPSSEVDSSLDTASAIRHRAKNVLKRQGRSLGRRAARAAQERYISRSRRSYDDFDGVAVYVVLQFSMPSSIDLRRQTMKSQLFVEVYYDMESVSEAYGEEETEDFDVEIVFTNLDERKNLAATASRVVDVDCKLGHCGQHIPDGKFRKKVEFFTGTFQQLFQLSPYPFDRQVFNISFTLSSTIGRVAMVSPVTYLDLDKSRGAYHWNRIECWSAVDPSTAETSGVCEITGTRLWGPVFLNTLTPSFLFAIIALLTLRIAVDKTMPRIGATLFALLILTQYRNVVVTSLPETEDFVWIDMFLFISIVAVFCVLLEHVVSDQLVKAGHVVYQHSLDYTLAYILPLLFFETIALISVLHSTAGTAICTLILIITGIIGFLWWQKHASAKIRRTSQGSVMDGTGTPGKAYTNNVKETILAFEDGGIAERESKEYTTVEP